jgi:hypothetical protein
MSLTGALARAVKAYERELFMDQLNAGFAALRADPKAWAEYVAETRLFDNASSDGLEEW